MNMKYENWISYRYLRSRNKGRFLSFLNFISIAGVAIGVAALIIVTGVMTGFGNNLKDKIIGTTPHIMIEKEVGIKDYPSLAKKLQGIDSVEAVSPYIQGNVFIEHAGQAMSLVLRGIDPKKEDKITRVKKYVKKGDFVSLEDDNIIIGSELARYFGYVLGDQVTLISPGSGLAGQGWRYNLTISGIFNTGMSDYDTSFVVVHLRKAQEIFDLEPGIVKGIGVSLRNIQIAEKVKQQIYGAIGYSFLVKTWIDLNQNLFDALFLEKWGLFIILTLMILVASFNIISTLIVTVTSKMHDIGVLKSIGASKKSIRRIFTKQGVYIGVLGVIWGLFFGVGLSYILRTYVKVPEKIYSIDRVPVDLQPFDIMMIVICAFVISYLATIYPARKASQLDPVEALRYE